MSDDDETVHLRKLLNILTHRKRLYELQKARLGERTPPDVDIGLSGTDQEIRLVEAKLRRPKIGADVLEAVGTDGLFLDVSVRLGHLAESVRTLGERVDIIEERTADGAAWREAETGKRERGQLGRLWRDRIIIALLLVCVAGGGLALAHFW